MKNEQISLAALISKIVSVYGCTEAVVYELIAITSEMKRGAKIASILNYCSDSSKHTEIADHSVIIGFDYGNMKSEDKEKLKKFDINTVDINRWNYESIDTKGMSIEDYKVQVREALKEALYEMNNPKDKERVNNDQWLNSVLVFNWNTERLAIIGQGIKKNTLIQGEYKKVKSAPKTVAKNLIKKQANLRSDKYKRLVVDNLTTVRLQGEELQIQ